MSEVSQIKEYQSASVVAIYGALAKAQSSMKHAEKAVSNTFFKSKYADLTACMDAARPFLSSNGLSVTQVTDIDATGNVLLITQLSHSSGEWIRGWYPIKPVKQDPQGMGSAITYGRRYTYCAITGVAPMDEDDDGNAASGKKESYANENKRFVVIKKAIEESDDPAATWGEYLSEINDWLEKDKTFYDQLVQSGAKRKKELAEMDAMNAGMPQEFGKVK